MTIQARGAFPLLKDRLNSSDSKLADIEKLINDKPVYEGSLVSFLKRQSVLKESVYVKVRDVSTIDVAVFFSLTRATVYTFQPDGDGWWRLFGETVRTMTEIDVLENYKKAQNYDNSSGVWVTSPPNYYTEEVGATFEKTIKGTGFNFNHRTNNRGGVWEFVIDGYITKKISTYSTTVKENESTLIAKGLPDITHTIVATFLGDDPENPPIGGASRGWANFYVGTGITPRTITPYIKSYSEDVGVNVSQTTSRKEYAFSVRPSETLMSARWIPEHGNLGAMKNITTKIMFGDREVIDLAPETTDNYREVGDVKFIVNYDGYYTENDLLVWNGRINQTINPEGYHNQHKINFLTDIQIVVGYPVMRAVNKTATGNDAVVTSIGQRKYLDPNINDGSSVLLDGEPVSVAHFTEQSGFQELKNIVIAFEVHDYANTMRVGKEGRPENPTRVELRTDGQRKSYFGAFDYHDVKAGEVYDFGWTYFTGEIFNSAELLPN